MPVIIHTCTIDEGYNMKHEFVLLNNKNMAMKRRMMHGSHIHILESLKN